MADAPVLSDFLCSPCREHFAHVQSHLQQEHIPVEVNPRLVRGLDYYCRTSFEVLAQGLGSQNAVCGGGRYDGLVEQLGGPAVPGIGFAIGVERLVMLLQAPAAGFYHPTRCIYRPAWRRARRIETFAIARRLRTVGCRVELESGGRGLKTQMRRADKLNARHVLILGENELTAGKGTVRDMQTKTDRSLAIDLSLPARDLLNAIQNINSC